MLKKKRWGGMSRRLLVVLCTLLLASGTFLVLGATVWAQQQPAQQGGTTQSNQNASTVDFWEPAIGTRTVYLTNDINDIHGEILRASDLGYEDMWYFDTTTNSFILYPDPLWPEPHQLYSSQYFYTEGISNLTPVYFDLAGPWYFWMTTPYKHIEEVKGINEAPDAAKFPAATYAVKYLIIGSGGERIWGWEYRSNDPNSKQWLTYGSTTEYSLRGEDESQVKSYTYYDPPLTQTFPFSIGTTGSTGHHTMKRVFRGKSTTKTLPTATYTVAANGKITLPAGTYDAVLIKFDWQSPPGDNPARTQIEYKWLVQGVGFVNDIGSLPNEIGPTFKTATGIQVMESQTAPAPSK